MKLKCIQTNYSKCISWNLSNRNLHLNNEGKKLIENFKHVYISNVFSHTHTHTYCTPPDRFSNIIIDCHQPLEIFNNFFLLFISLIVLLYCLVCQFNSNRFLFSSFFSFILCVVKRPYNHFCCFIGEWWKKKRVQLLRGDAE